MNEAELNEIYIGIYAGSVTAYNLPTNLYEFTASTLQNSTYKGWGKSLHKSEVASREWLLLNDFRENINVFSGAKTFDQIKESQRLILDKKGVLRPFKEYLADVEELNALYNKAWLETERITALAQAQNARQWLDFEKDKESFPYLKYHTQEDSRVRHSHKALNGFTAKVDDPYWSGIMPQNDFRCFTKDTNVLTPKGYVSISDIKKGDLVIGGSGKHQLVTATTKKSHSGTKIRIIGKCIRFTSTPNHRILTLKGWIRAENLKIGDIIINIREKPSINNRVSNIQKMYSCTRNYIMSLQRQGESITSNAFNTNIKFWNKNINKFKINMILMFNFIPQAFDMVYKKLFASSRWSISYASSFRMLLSFFKASFLSKFPKFRISKGGFNLHSLGKFSKRCGRFLSFPIVMVKFFFVSVLKIIFTLIGLLQSSFIIINPLRFNSLATVSDRYVAMLQKISNSSITYTPPIRKGSERELISNIQEFEGYSNGAPLHFFDSVNSFLKYAFHNCKFERINNITNLHNNNENTYNLTVENDISYIAKGAIVHNCRCWVEQLQEGSRSTKEWEKQKVKENNDGSPSDEKIKSLKDVPTKLFDYNPAKDRIIFKTEGIGSHPYMKVDKAFEIQKINNFGMDINFGL